MDVQRIITILLPNDPDLRVRLDVLRDVQNGTVHGLRKGLLIGTPKGKSGRLCGVYGNGYRFYDRDGKRRSTKALAWFSSSYMTTMQAPA